MSTEVERVVEGMAEAIYLDDPIIDPGECIDGFQVTPAGPIPWSALAELDEWAEIQNECCSKARAALDFLLEHFLAGSLAELTTWDNAAAKYGPEANAEILSLRQQVKEAEAIISDAVKSADVHINAARVAGDHHAVAQLNEATAEARAHLARYSNTEGT